MFGIVVEIQGRPAGLHSRTEPRGQDDFFYLDAAWLNEGRCPGGRPSVSENSGIVANSMENCSLKATTLTTNEKRKTHQPRCSLPESAGTGRCSLFLGRLDQGLVGNAESTHVNRPKGKAMLVPWVGRCCKFFKNS